MRPFLDILWFSRSAAGTRKSSCYNSLNRTFAPLKFYENLGVAGRAHRTDGVAPQMRGQEMRERLT